MTRKNKIRQRRRQKQNDDEMSSVTTDTNVTDCFIKSATKKPTQCSRRQCPQPKVFSSQEKGRVDAIKYHIRCADPCQQCRYDAVIHCSQGDGKDAFWIKTWLEEKLELQHGDSRHCPKIELAENLHSSYVDSLEIASKCTDTIIVLYTKYWEDDLLFRNSINALWTWKTVKDYQIFFLLFGFGEGEAPPKCIPVRDSHAVRFQEKCPYFRNRMVTRLSQTLPKRLQHDETRRQCERREGRGQQAKERLVKQPHHPPTSVGDGELTPVSSNQDVSAEDRERVRYTPSTDECDSGIASDATLVSYSMSGLASLPSTADPPSQLQESLSGPFGIQPELHLASSDLVSSSSQPQSAELQGTFGTAENMRLQIQIRNTGKRDTSKDPDLKSLGEACQNNTTGGEMSALSTYVTQNDKSLYSTGQIEVGHREERRVVRNHCRSHSQPMASSTFADDERSFGSRSTTYPSASHVRKGLRNALSSVNGPPVSTHTDMNETLESDAATESEMTDQVVKLGNVRNSKRGGVKKTECTDLQEGGEQLFDGVQNSVPRPAVHNQMNFAGSSSATPHKSVAGKALAEGEHETGSNKDHGYQGYLTPVLCNKTDCNHCCETIDEPVEPDFDFGIYEDQKLPDTGYVAPNNAPLAVDLGQRDTDKKPVKIQCDNMQDTEDIKIEIQKHLMSVSDTVTPQKHSYINSDPDDQAAKELSSAVKSQHRARLSVCNPIPVLRSDKLVHEGIDHDVLRSSKVPCVAEPLVVPSVAELRVDHPGTISIHHADNVIIGTGHCHAIAPGLDRRESCHVRSARNGLDTDSQTTTSYDTWPYHSIKLSEMPVRPNGDKGQAVSPGPRLPPRNITDGQINTIRSGSIRPRSSTLSKLSAVFCCFKKKTDKSREMETTVEELVEYGKEDPYNCINDLYLPTLPRC